METSRHAASVADIGQDNLILMPGTYLIEPSSNERTVAGIAVPGSKETKVGKLIMSGPQMETLKYPEIPDGSTIYYLQTSSLEVMLAGKPYHIVFARDIRLAIAEKRELTDIEFINMVLDNKV